MLAKAAVTFTLSWMLLASPALTGSGAARDRSAKAFLTSLYAPYLAGAHNEGAGFDSPASYSAAFEPRLAALLIKENEAEFQRQNPILNDALILNHAILIDADSWLIRRVRIAIVPTGTRTAKATVRFRNLGKEAALKLDLVKLSIGWRIADIHLKSGDLRARLVRD
jgi:hypothetical protein